MKRFYLSKLLLLIAILSACSATTYAQVTLAYSATPYSYTVPNGVFSIVIDASGASGGYGSSSSYAGGKGGRVQCTLATTPGSVLQFMTGGKGGDGNSCCGLTQHTKGTNGGGYGIDYGGSGGGASDVRVAPYTLNDRVVVAAGGGGGSGYCGDRGGDGGGLSGVNGTECGSYNSYAGGGATQTAPGPGSSTGPGGSGTFGQGGNAYGGYYYGTGGGGGWYGGGGSYGGGGGGGSSYVASGVTSITMTPGYSATDGSITYTEICTPPTAGVVNGVASICLGNTTTYSTTISAGGVWSSSNTSVAKVDSVGNITSVSPGTASISYSVSFKCGSQANAKIITINPPPTAIIGNGNACFTKTTQLSDATPGGTWASSNVSIAKVGSNTGIVTGVSLNTAIITYKLPTGCFTTFTQTVNPIPSQYVVSVAGSGQFCVGGSGARILMNGSESGVNYDIYNSGVKVAGPYPGVGSSSTYDFGLQTTLGTNTVLGTYSSTGCYNTMSGSATISLAPLPPAAAIVVTGGGTSGVYCQGDPGLNIILKASSPGIRYQLYQSAMPVGDTMSNNSGADIDFGAHAAGTYRIVGTNNSTGCVNDMANTVTISVNALPNIYTLYGGGGYCAGGAGARDTLSKSDVGVNYELFLGTSTTGIVKAGTGGVLDFGLLPFSGSYSVVATNAAGCKNNMSGSASIVVYPLPAQYNVGTTGHYCTGAAGAVVTLSYSDIGVDYRLTDGTSNIGGSVSGTGALIDFGKHPSGTYYVTAITRSTQCGNNMTGSATITTDPLPNPFIVTDGGSYCLGGNGVPVKLSGTEINTNYQLYVNGTPIGSPMAGTTAGINFGMQTLAGSYTVSASNTVTGCTNGMNGGVSVIINALPNIDTVNVTAGGNYCVGGSGVRITQDGSSSNSTYQLYLNGVAVLDSYSPMIGTGAPLDFGTRTAVGTYTVKATNVATCTSMMAGSPLVAVTPLPTPFLLSGGGAYCSGGTGNHVILTSSESGVNYRLLFNGVPDSVVLGTGGAIDFGPQSRIGNYSVAAVNASTACANNMTGTLNVSVTALPTAYNVTGGGAYCSGTPGTHIFLTASNTGIDYQLYNGSVPMGGTIHGSGYSLDFGLQTVAGNYKVVATNATSGCRKDMTGNKSVTVALAPSDYSITGGGNYCTGGTGKNIGTVGSDTGVSYQLWKDGAFVASLPGNGNPLDFGVRTKGSYTVMGINNMAGCTTTMSGVGIVTLDPVPNQFNVSGGGSFCTGGAGKNIYLSNSNAGIDYNLVNNISGTVATLPGNGLSLDFGAQTLAGAYTVVAVNTTTSCSSNMLASAMINIIPAPTAHKVFGGGSFCAGGTGVGIMLDGSESGIKYQLYKGAASVGFPAMGVNDTLDMGVLAVAGTYTVKATNPATGCTSDMLSNASVSVNPVVIPSVMIGDTSGLVVCAGTSVTYTAKAVNGGSTPIYEWHSIIGTKDSLLTSTNDTSIVALGVTGEIIKVKLVSNATCATTTWAADSVIMTVHATGNPTVAISATPGLSVCPGSSVTLSVAAPAFGGVTPTYKWTKGGGSSVLSTGTTYTYIPSNNDKITLEMTSDDACATSSTATTNANLTVQTPAAPVFTIESNPTSLGSVAQGQTVTLKAVVTANGGTSQSYQWFLNGGQVNTETSNTFVSDNFFNGDSVTCVVTAMGDCGAVTSAQRAIIKVHNLAVANTGASISDIRVMPNPNKGAFTVKGNIATLTEGTATVRITNMIGQVVYSSDVAVHGGVLDQRIQLANGLANGMYILNVTAGGDNAAFHFVLEQ